MTVSVTTDFSGPYTGNGATTSFPFTFKALSTSEVSVLVDGVVIVSGYTVTLNAGGNGGTVVMAVAPTAGAVLLVASDPSFAQGIGFTNAGPFLPESHDEAADRAAVRDIHLKATVNRSLRGPVGEVVNPLPTVAQRAGKFLSFDSSGHPVGASGAGADAALRTDLAAGGGGALVNLRPAGVTGDGVANDGPALATAIAVGSVSLPFGTYKNTTVTLTLPFGKTMRFASGADLTTSGSGSNVLSGVAIREGYNPSNLTGWTGSAPFSYEGLSVELGGYGPRQFGAFGTPTALNGSINIPASSTIANHATGVSGYAKSASTTTGGVAIYGEANRTAANALIWGFNTRTQDGGFGGLNVWGYEMDMNVDNVTTTAIGFDAVGGSTVEPTLSIAYLCQPIGVFATPKKRWTYAFRSVDAAAQIGLELGAQGEIANTASQIFRMNYRNASNAVTTGFVVQISSAGDTSIIGGPPAKLFVIKTAGASANNIQMIDNGIGFYGATPANKQTVTGARGGNTALASVLTALANLGLITDSSTA